MPFIFICLVFFDIVRKYLSKASIAWISSSLTIAALGLTGLWRSHSLQLCYPIAQYAHALPGFLFGIFLSHIDATPQRAAKLLLFAALLAAISSIPYVYVGIPYLLGMAMCLILPFPIFTMAKNKP